jgi:cytochrome P450
MLLSATELLYSVLAGAALLALFYFLFARRSENEGIVPHHVGKIFFGSVFEMGIDGILTTMMNLTRRYGGIFTLNVLLKKYLVITDAALFREIQRKQPKYTRRSKSTDYPSEILGTHHSLLFVNGTEWSRMRKLVAPAFSQKNVNAMVNDVFLAADKMVSLLSTFATNNETVPFDVEMQLYTCRVLKAVAFGEERKALGNVANDSSIVEYFGSKQFPADLEETLVYSVKCANHTTRFGLWSWKYSSDYKHEAIALAAQSRIDEAAAAVLKKKKRLLASSSLPSSSALIPSQQQRKSLMDLLIREEGTKDTPALSDEEILANIRLFFAAGTETTSSMFPYLMCK